LKRYSDQGTPMTEESNNNIKEIENPDKKDSPVNDLKQPKSESMDENLERLAALNLSNDHSFQRRYSNALIRLVSAAAGLAVLFLIYFIIKLFLR